MTYTDLVLARNIAMVTAEEINTYLPKYIQMFSEEFLRDIADWEEYFLRFDCIYDLWAVLFVGPEYKDVKQAVKDMAEGIPVPNHMYRFADIRLVMDSYRDEVSEDTEFWEKYIMDMTGRFLMSIAIRGDNYVNHAVEASEASQALLLKLRGISCMKKSNAKLR